MLYVCEACGAWLDGPRVEGDAAVCDACGHRRPFLRLPLHVVTGASGAGKSTLAGRLPAALPGCVVLDMDVLWSDDALVELDGWRRRWLRLAMNVGQGGRPVVLVGTLLGQHVAHLPERALFREIRYLALTASPAELERRLRARPRWRAALGRLANSLDFNEWIAANAASTEPPMRLLDTGTVDVGEAVHRVARWVAESVPAARAGWRVRRARRDDLDRFDGLGSALHLAYCRDQYERAERGDLDMLVAVGPADVPVGKIHVAVRGAVGVVGDAAVRDELRGLGIGSALLTAAEAAIRGRGAAVAELGVADENPGARRLYERHGYRADRAEVFRWAIPGPDGEPVTADHPGVVMRKALGG